MSDFLFPDVGEGIHEGKLVSWKIKEGDTVRQDQVLCSVETDKAIVEIPSPKPGTITKLHHSVGAVVKVGQPLISYADTAGGSAASVAPPAIKPVSNEFARAPERGTARVESNLIPVPPTQEKHEPQITPLVATQGPAPIASSGVLASPSTRRLAHEKGVDITRVHGTGDHGRVTSQDVLGFTGAPQARPTQQFTQAAQAPITTQQPAMAAPLAVAGQTIPYAGMRKAIGEHMQQSQAIPSVTLFAETDVSAVVGLRDHLKARAEIAGVKLTYLPIFLKALCAALKRHPILNSRLTDQGIQVFSEIHLGIAVDTERGLMVPVIRNSQEKSVLAMAREIAALVDGAKAGKLTREQITGSTFSVTSIGPLRVEGFTPMINSPEAAILGIGGILDKPWVKNGQIVIEKVATFSLTFDHRILDGAEAARFLTDLVNLIEDPELLVLEGI